VTDVGAEQSVKKKATTVSRPSTICTLVKCLGVWVFTLFTTTQFRERLPSNTLGIYGHCFWLSG